jgi:hypothetical protein
MTFAGPTPVTAVTHRHRFGRRPGPDGQSTKRTLDVRIRTGSPIRDPFERFRCPRRALPGTARPLPVILGSNSGLVVPPSDWPAAGGRRSSPRTWCTRAAHGA